MHFAFRRRIAIFATLAAFAACEPVPRHILTLQFDDSGKHITISAATSLPRNRDARDRASVEHLREDLVMRRDEWSQRFANATPQSDRTILDRSEGELTNVSRSATIDADNLQKFFYDLPISATVTRGDGYEELAIYPGTSTRATRQQREDYDKRLQRGAEAAVTYFRSLAVLYGYLDRHPQRASDIFDAMLRDEDEEGVIRATKVELEMVTSVRNAIDGVLKVDESGELTREAELVNNPFPATIIVRTPTEPTLVEGFERDERGLVIQTRPLLDAVAALEGRWVTPDPVAVILRMPKNSKSEDAVPVLANAPRHAQPVVSAAEVMEAIASQLRPAVRYRVRFVTR